MGKKWKKSGIGYCYCSFSFFFFLLLAFIIIDPLHSSSHFVLVYISILWITTLFFLTNNSPKKNISSRASTIFYKIRCFLLNILNLISYRICYLFIYFYLLSALSVHYVCLYLRSRRALTNTSMKHTNIPNLQIKTISASTN